MKRLLALLLVPLAALPALPGPKPADRPLPARDAAKAMTLPDGFRATLFAGEPDVVQPIAFAFDDRGRLWVAECLSYPNWTKEKTGKDRVVILEDADGDGVFDKRTVFYDKGANLTGIEVGHGGVWLCSLPNVLFVPDRDGDDRPDGPPEVKLGGWSLECKHNAFNSLAWGPDGWLYGCNGITATSHVGPKRVPFNCGVWRYHPTRGDFEPVAWGTTNPWGLDWDERGEMFITNCVIAHLWHVIPGAHYERMYGQDLNPHSYKLMATCADHLHWAGGHWSGSRNPVGAHSDAGGGHAHVGCMIYQGDNWPDRYRGGVFTCNLHGNRVNHDVLERQGSGYVARHGKDFLFANDPWFRGLAIKYGPDGGVYLTDWTDTGECHNYVVADTTNGRVFKIAHGKVKPFKEDMARRTDAELIERLTHKNEWHGRHARRLLHERAVAKKLEKGTGDELLKRLRHEAIAAPAALQYLWAAHVTGTLNDSPAAQFDSPHDCVRAWAVRLALEQSPSAATLKRLAALAKDDASQLVRLHLAGGLQRLPNEDRWPIAEQLVRHASDATDSNLPLMIWYGVEPLAPADPIRACKLLTTSSIPLVRELLARRLASLEDRAALARIVGVLAGTETAALQRDVMRGLQAALEGRKLVPLPKGWAEAYPKLADSPLAEVRERALDLAVVFGDEKALSSLKAIATDSTAGAPLREKAVRTLVSRQTPDLAGVLHGLLTDAAVRGAALRGLAAYKDDATPTVIIRHYGSFTEQERGAAMETLASRPAYALALLDAVEKGALPRADLSAFTVRQMAALKDRAVDEGLAKVYGRVRPASGQKTTLMAKYRGQLNPDSMKAANLGHGRAVYNKVCLSCHKLFGEGGDVGPELTGSQRANLDYLLENLLDPSAVVAQEYQVVLLETRNGRTLTGIVKQETDRALTLRTQNDTVTIAKDDLETRSRSPQSMMPEGMLESLSREEVRDLIGYLMSPNQVPPSAR